MYIGGLVEEGYWPGLKFNYFYHTQHARQEYVNNGPAFGFYENVGAGYAAIATSPGGAAGALAPIVDAMVFTPAGNVGIGATTPTHPLQMGSGAYCSAAGVWTSVSDRNAKENFTAIAPGEVLAKVAAMPITQWKYKVEPNGIKHIGPVAQDFHAAFGLGDSDRAIGSVDETGVALAAIQGLNQKLEEERAKNAALKQELDRQAARLSRLEQAVDARPVTPGPASASQPASAGGQ